MIRFHKNTQSQTTEHHDVQKLPGLAACVGGYCLQTVVWMTHVSPYIPSPPRPLTRQPCSRHTRASVVKTGRRYCSPLMPPHTIRKSPDTSCLYLASARNDQEILNRMWCRQGNQVTTNWASKLRRSRTPACVFTTGSTYCWPCIQNSPAPLAIISQVRESDQKR
jgi:hypothetical protein